MNRPVIARLVASAAALLLALALVPGAAFADEPTYTISVTKTANPTEVPEAGGSVTYTVAVKNTGTGFFNTVTASDPDCTLGAPTGDDGNGKLDADETWTYACTVASVVPPHTNTVTVDACHEGGPADCNNAKHEAEATAQATVTAATPAPTATVAPTVAPSLPPTDGVVRAAGAQDALGLALLALAIVMAGTVIVAPAAMRRR